MKVYGVYCIGVYLLIGILFGGNHYFILPTFLVFITAIGYFSNRKKALKEVKYNLFWLGTPLVALLLGNYLTTTTTRAISLLYSISITIILSMIFVLLNDHSKTRKVISLFGIVLTVFVSLILVNYFTENKSFLEEFTSLKHYWRSLTQYFFI